MLASELCGVGGREQFTRSYKQVVEGTNVPHMSLERMDTNRVCWLCRAKSVWKCECGVVVCSPLMDGPRGKCWTMHIEDARRVAAGFSPMKKKK
mmetsp:Transcript_34514/g.70548  ORF Transcript_34514/g.70548 Transcript_34514/m.70548 type:complete len:94 (-) Transcript_34514:113-394(-)